MGDELEAAARSKYFTPEGRRRFEQIVRDNGVPCYSFDGDGIKCIEDACEAAGGGFDAEREFVSSARLYAQTRRNTEKLRRQTEAYKKDCSVRIMPACSDKRPPGEEPPTPYPRRYDQMYAQKFSEFERHMSELGPNF